jgi:hypothetical protein
MVYALPPLDDNQGHGLYYAGLADAPAISTPIGNYARIIASHASDLDVIIRLLEELCKDAGSLEPEFSFFINNITGLLTINPLGNRDLIRVLFTSPDLPTHIVRYVLTPSEYAYLLARVARITGAYTAAGGAIADVPNPEFDDETWGYLFDEFSTKYDLDVDVPSAEDIAAGLTTAVAAGLGRIAAIVGRSSAAARFRSEAAAAGLGSMAAAAGGGGMSSSRPGQIISNSEEESAGRQASSERIPATLLGLGQRRGTAAAASDLDAAGGGAGMNAAMIARKMLSSVQPYGYASRCVAAPGDACAASAPLTSKQLAGLAVQAEGVWGSRSAVMQAATAAANRVAEEEAARRAAAAAARRAAEEEVAARRAAEEEVAARRAAVAAARREAQAYADRLGAEAVAARQAELQLLPQRVAAPPAAPLGIGAGSKRKLSTLGGILVSPHKQIGIGATGGARRQRGTRRAHRRITRRQRTAAHRRRTIRRRR